MLTKAGPRDWSPPEQPTSNAPRYQRRPYTPPRRMRPRNAAAWLSVLLGAGSLVVGVAPLFDSAADGRSFVLSSIGLSAMAIGLHARRLWRTGCATAGRLPKLGVWLGVIGTVLMLVH